MTGYDIDGVLTAGIRPEPGSPHVVISGRLHTEWYATVEFLRGLGVTGAVYLRPYGEYGDRKAAGNWKGMMVSLLGCSRFYEDDPYQAALVKEMNPSCDVVLVGKGSVELPKSGRVTTTSTEPSDTPPSEPPVSPPPPPVPVTRPVPESVTN